MTNKQSQKPITTIRDGRISASVWKNEGEKKSYYSVTFSRVYTDAEGKLQNSSSFSGLELLKLARLAAKTYDELAILRADEADDEGGQ